MLAAITKINGQVIDIEKLPTAKKWEWTGSVGANTTVYNAKGIENRSNPFSWNLNGNFNARVMETLDLPFAFSVKSISKHFYQVQYPVWHKPKIQMSNVAFRSPKPQP